jgi:hypothetical protein
LRHTENPTINEIPSTPSLGRDSTFSSVYNFPALSKSPTWLPRVTYAVPEANRYDTNVTTLDNGLRVCIYSFVRNKIFIVFFPRLPRKNFLGIFVQLELLSPLDLVLKGNIQMVFHIFLKN